MLADRRMDENGQSRAGGGSIEVGADETREMGSSGRRWRWKLGDGQSEVVGLANWPPIGQEHRDQHLACFLFLFFLFLLCTPALCYIIRTTDCTDYAIGLIIRGIATAVFFALLKPGLCSVLCMNLDLWLVRLLSLFEVRAAMPDCRTALTSVRLMPKFCVKI